MKDIKILISSVFIFTAFFLGILFQKQEEKKEASKKDPLYVNITSTKTTLTINKNNPDISIMVNGKDMTGETLDITK